MSTRPKSYKKLISVGIVLIFLDVLFLPIIPVTYETTEPRQSTETYEKEPYQVTKTDSLYIEKWNIFMSVYPSGEADIAHFIVFNGDNISVVNIDVPLPTWRYEFLTLFGLVTPFYGKSVYMNLTGLRFKGY